MPLSEFPSWNTSTCNDIVTIPDNLRKIQEVGETEYTKINHLIQPGMEATEVDPYLGDLVEYD